MSHPQAIDQIAAFSKIPSLALTTASPSTRLAVERHYRGQSHVTATLDPIPSKQHELQRTISYHMYLETSFNTSILPSLWWLQNEQNRNTPLAVELHAYFKLSETKKGKHVKCVQVRPHVPTHLHYIFNTTDLEAYLQLHSLRALSVHDIRDLQWLKPLVNLEELDIRGMQAEPNEIIRISALSNLRVLTLDIQHIRSMQWVSGCDKLRELTLLGDASRTSHLNAIAELQTLCSLTIGFRGLNESMDWLPDCCNLEKLDVEFQRGPYPPVWTLPRLSYLRMHYQKFSKASEEILQSGPEPSVDYSSRLTHVDLSDSETCNIQWLMNCRLINVLSVKQCKNITDLSSMGYLAGLTVLDIGNTEVSSIDWISNCVALIDLNISNCLNLKDLRPIGTLKNLKMLDMENTVDKEQTASSWMPQCAQLEELDASESYIQWSAVSQLKMLRKLSLRRYYTDTHLEALTQCTRLEELDLAGCWDVSDITPLTRLSRLRCIHIKNTNVRLIEPLASCAALEKLYMDAEKITDLQSISKFPSLSYIDFGVSAVTIKAIEECLSALPYLQINMPYDNDPQTGSYTRALYDPQWQSHRHSAKKRKSYFLH